MSKKSESNKRKKVIKQRDMALRALLISGKGGAHVDKMCKSKKERKDAKKAIKKALEDPPG
jgi:hypothetical protein